MTKPPCDPELEALLAPLGEPTIEPSAHFARNVLAAIHRDERVRTLPPSLPFPWLPLAVGIAAVAGVAAFAVLSVARGHEITLLDAVSAALALVPLALAPWFRRYFEI